MGDVGDKALALLLHVLELVDHVVEGAGDLADLVVRVDADLDGHVPLAELLCGVRELA